jgi:hypothetical protein
LKKKLNVLSLIAPFIAALARSAGATNSWYEIGSPFGPGIVPMSAPSPKPIESR